LRARDRQLGLLKAEEDRQVASSSTEPPLNFNSVRDIPRITSQRGFMRIWQLSFRYLF
jgi:hypothetical protein